MGVKIYHVIKASAVGEGGIKQCRDPTVRLSVGPTWAS